ncbi:MAG TPA: SGNH family hydrolase [Xanthobacteraceae bacterium]|nr:SGNH family hydrolase [Xanthobacteraceae bacterium]
MVRGACLRFLIATALVAAEAVAAVTLLAVVSAPSDAQFFWGDRSSSQNRRSHGLFDWFEQQQAAPPQLERTPPPVDYSRAPPPKKADPKTEGTATTPILVLGDGMADWLAYGLELAYADTPEIGVLRRHRTNSGLIRTEVRSDPRGEYPDWPQAARDLIAAQKPKFVLMMIGVNDRRPFRETGPAVPTSRAAKPAQPPAEDPASLELDKPAADKAREIKAAAAPEPAAPAGNRTLEFRSDVWGEAYSRRIDDTIAALKTSGVPVFWVGLPPLRGQKAAADIPFLNDLYRSRADKAGILYIDVWDGFVDEDGRYAQYGPDVEGQTRRLRTADGVYFTQAGARKLAHYVEREVQRWMSTRAAPVAVSIPEEPKVEPATPSRPGPHARPMSGPAVPLVAERGNETADLLGGNARQPTSDAMAAKVLVQGEAIPAPAGRADDFAWPRRDVAPVGSDPVVATTELPMTPMVAERSSTVAVAATAATETSGAAAPPAKPPVRRLGPPRPTFAEMQQSQSFYRPDYRRPPVVQQQQFSFPSLFSGPSWFSRRW